MIKMKVLIKKIFLWFSSHKRLVFSICLSIVVIISLGVFIYNINKIIFLLECFLEFNNQVRVILSVGEEIDTEELKLQTETECDNDSDSDSDSLDVKDKKESKLLLGLCIWGGVTCGMYGLFSLSNYLSKVASALNAC